jgi:hypothetical protein
MILDQKNDQQQQVDIYLVVRRYKCHHRFVLDRLKHSREDDVLDGVGEKIISGWRWRENYRNYLWDKPVGAAPRGWPGQTVQR